MVAVISGPALSIAAPQVAAKDMSPTGVWTGWHQCGGQRVATTAIIIVDEQGHVTGVREFYPSVGDESRASGSFRLAGAYDSASRSITLLARDWINHPNRYGKCDFVGTVDAGGAEISGSSPACRPGCDAFHLRRE
jgi:hypothetical protein